MPTNEGKRRGAELMPMNKRRVGSCQGWGRLGWVGSGWVGSLVPFGSGRLWSVSDRLPTGVRLASHGCRIGSGLIGSAWLGSIGSNQIS